jgi:hypothetical protein
VPWTVPGPDDPLSEAATLLSLDRAEPFQLPAAGPRKLREGIQHLQDVGEFLRIVVGGDELRRLLLELVPQPGTVLLGIGRVDDRLQPLSPDDLGNPVAHELALAHCSPPGCVSLTANAEALTAMIWADRYHPGRPVMMSERMNSSHAFRTGSASWCYVAECGNKYASA